MTTARLSQRRDLVEGLDAEGVVDYLSLHGVLDPAVLAGLDKKATNTQINTTILRHIEQHGNKAVTLLIEALRRSWQLQLANHLDIEQKIIPTSGNSYFRNERLKGQITIRIETEALKLVDSEANKPDTSLDTTILESTAKPTRRIPKDIDNCVLVKDVSDGALDIDVSDGALAKDDAEEEDFVKPSSCWCFCLSRKSKSKSKYKKDTEKQNKTKANKTELQQTSSRDSYPKPKLKTDTKNKPHRKKLEENSKSVTDRATESILTKSSKENNSTKEKHTNKKSKSLKSKSKIAEKYSVPDRTDGPSLNEARELRSVSLIDVIPELDKISKRGIKSGRGDDSSTNGEIFGVLQGGHSRLKKREHAHTVQVSSSEIVSKSSFRIWDQNLDNDTRYYSSVHYNPKIQLIKLGDGQTKLGIPKKQYSNTELKRELWICEGRFFQEKASQLCERIAQELKNEIIKYFELERGVLVWDVVSSGTGVNVVSVYMQQSHVKFLQRDLKDGSLLSTIYHIFSNVNKFDIQEMKFRIVVNERELNTALEELS